MVLVHEYLFSMRLLRGRLVAQRLFASREYSIRQLFACLCVPARPCLPAGREASAQAGSRLCVQQSAAKRPRSKALKWFWFMNVYSEYACFGAGTSRSDPEARRLNGSAYK
jgi:hypothetical protein